MIFLKSMRKLLFLLSWLIGCQSVEDASGANSGQALLSSLVTADEKRQEPSTDDLSPEHAVEPKVKPADLSASVSSEGSFGLEGPKEQGPIPESDTNGAQGFAAECPAPEVACGQELDPVLCSAGTYAGVALPRTKKLHVWAPSACLGRRALAQEACAANLLPSQLGLVQCVPDASNGECPPNSDKCLEGKGSFACIAHRYAAEAFSPDQLLRGEGTSECKARLALAFAACRENLKPSQLSEITCEKDLLTSECKDLPEPCSGPLYPSICAAGSLEGHNLPTPLEAQAESFCAAKAQLARLACAAQGRPSTLDNVTCQVSQQ